jgi:hypothetical protein
LEEGGALLTFPAGEIEPDPATFGLQRAAASLQNWSDSYTLFARLAPRTQFVPALVSHVISPDAQRHPLTLLRRTARDKEKLAAALQVALPRYRDLVARVTFGSSPNTRPDEAQAFGASIAAQMRQLIFADESTPHMTGSPERLILSRNRLLHGKCDLLRTMFPTRQAPVVSCQTTATTPEPR